MRWLPKRPRRVWMTCSATRASASQPRAVKSSRSGSSSPGFWARGESLRSSSSRVCSRRASSLSACARRLTDGFFRFRLGFSLGLCDTDTHRGKHLALDLARHVGMLLQKVARIVFPLPDALFAVGIPRARLLDDAMHDAELDNLAFARDAFPI